MPLVMTYLLLLLSSAAEGLRDKEHVEVTVRPWCTLDNDGLCSCGVPHWIDVLKVAGENKAGASLCNVRLLESEPPVKSPEPCEE